MRKINLGLVDDDKLISELLCEYFAHFAPEISIVFTANSGEECLEKVKEKNNVPEILLLDIKMKGMDGIAVLQSLKKTNPSIKIIVMSSHYQPSFIGFMMKTGVSGFIPKDIAPKKVIQVVQNVFEHGYFFTPEQIEILRSQISSKVPELSIDNENALTEREIDVLKLLCFQKTAKEIGEKLFISPKTVESHKNSLFAKTGVKNIVGLVIYAIQKGYVDMQELSLI